VQWIFRTVLLGFWSWVIGHRSCAGTTAKGHCEVHCALLHGCICLMCSLLVGLVAADMVVPDITWFYQYRMIGLVGKCMC